MLRVPFALAMQWRGNDRPGGAGAGGIVAGGVRSCGAGGVESVSTLRRVPLGITQVAHLIYYTGPEL